MVLANLPNIRSGAGLFWKLKDEPVYCFTIRDSGAPTNPNRIDIQAGKVESEKMKNAQIREGTEETVIVKKNSNKISMGVPNSIKDTKTEENLKNRYAKLARRTNSHIKSYDSNFYYNSNISKPVDLPSYELEDDYISGYTIEFQNDISIELICSLTIDFEKDLLMTESEYKIYDIEYYIDQKGNVKYHNRPSILLNIDTGYFVIYHCGFIKDQGYISNIHSVLSRNFGWDMKNVKTPATSKVQSILKYDSACDEVQNTLVSDDYINKLSSIF